MGSWAFLGHTGGMMDSDQIARELERTLLRYKAGLIDLDRAKQEQSLLMAALKAREQAVLEEKISRLEAIMEQREEDSRWQSQGSR